MGECADRGRGSRRSVAARRLLFRLEDRRRPCMPVPITAILLGALALLAAVLAASVRITRARAAPPLASLLLSRSIEGPRSRGR
jgi:hypothetical protein